MRLPVMCLCAVSSVFCGGIKAANAQAESKGQASLEAQITEAEKQLSLALIYINATERERIEGARILEEIAQLATKKAEQAEKEGKRHAAWDMVNSTALNNLGYCYEKGLGVTRNPNKAFALYSEASKLGNQKTWWNNYARHNVARCYNHGIGVLRDREEAARGFKEASEWYNKKIKLHPTTKDERFEKIIAWHLGDKNADFEEIVQKRLAPQQGYIAPAFVTHKVDEPSVKASKAAEHPTAAVSMTVLGQNSDSAVEIDSAPTTGYNKL
jgi:hypothetical protein